MVLGSLHPANHLFVQLPGPHVVLVVDVVARVGRVEVDDCTEKVPMPEEMTIQEIFHAAPSHFGNGNICPPHLAWFGSQEPLPAGGYSHKRMVQRRFSEYSVRLFDFRLAAHRQSLVFESSFSLQRERDLPHLRQQIQDDPLAAGTRLIQRTQATAGIGRTAPFPTNHPGWQIERSGKVRRSLAGGGQDGLQVIFFHQARAQENSPDMDIKGYVHIF